MDVRKYLKQIDKYDLLIENKIEEIRKWKERAVDISPNTNGVRVQTSTRTDIVGKAVSIYMDLENELVETMNAAVRKRQEIIETIEQLPPIYYDVLHKRYVQKMDIQTIACEIDRSYRCVTVRHARALEKLQIILNDTQ